MEFHAIKSVTPLKNMILDVGFYNGISKKYDVKKLISKYKIFKILQDEELFNKVKVDTGGYGIVWNEEIDLSSEEIWNNGY